MRHQRQACLVTWLGLCLLPDSAWGQAEKEPAPTITLQAKHILKVQDRPYALSFSQDGSRFAANDGRFVRVWDTRTGKQVSCFTNGKDFIFRLKLSPDGQLVAFTSGDGNTIALLDVASGKILRTLSGHTRDISSIAFSRNGKMIASLSDEVLKLWDVDTGKEVTDIPNRMKRARYAWPLVFSPDGETLAVIPNLDEVHLLNVRDGKEVRRFSLPEARFRGVRGVVFSPDGRFLAAGRPAGENCVTVWDVNTGKQSWVFRWPVLFFDQEVLARSKGQVLRPDSRRSPGLLDLVFTADSRTLIAGCSDGMIRAWELSTGGLRYRVDEMAAHMVTAPASALFASSGGDEESRQIIVRDFRTCVLPPHQSAPNDQEKAWADLGASNAALAFQRVREFASAPVLAVQFLDKRLPTTTPVKAAEIERLIQELDDDQFALRDRARQRLTELGELAKDGLSQALNKSSSLSVESRKKVQEILDILGSPSAGDRLRFVRAIEILEMIGPPESRLVLERLAGGDPAHLLTREAKAALRRLNTN